VVDGLKLRDFPQMFTGALMVALLAIALDALFALIGRLTVSEGLRVG
jgi:osmoprotectant transport system permease protein